MSVVFYYKPQQIEVLIETAAQYSLQCLQLLSLLQRCTASSRMWFTLSRIACVWCCILSSLCAQEPAESQLESSHAQLAAEGDGEEVTGRSSSSTFRRFQLVCGKSITHFQELLDHPQLTDVYSTIKREFVASDGLDHLFHKKIVPNIQGSVCQNLNVTCCKPAMEKSTETLARDEYKFYYDEIFQSHSETCLSPGKRFHSSSIKIIRKLVQELEERVNHSLAMTLPLDSFRDLSNYLASFSSAPDICRLPDLLDAQVQTLIDLMLTSIFQDDEEYSYLLEDRASMACARNISSSFITVHQRTIMKVMQKHLLDLSLLSQFFQQAYETINIMRQHTFSRPCVTAITRMRYCPLCGGYGNFKPCLFKCINTLRGCFADLAEVQSDFIGFISAARVLSEDVVKEMGPETFQKSYFNQFVLMMEELRAKEGYLKETLVLECSITPQNNGTEHNETDTLNRKKRRSSLIQPIQGSKSRPKLDPLVEQLDLEVLTTVVEAEMGCLERVAGKMKDVSDDICLMSRYDVAHRGNSQCWTGSVLGRYDHPKAGFMKVDQLKNPEYTDIPMTTAPRYSQLISALHAITRKINSTIAFNKVCLDSDDEDCFRNPFQDCRMSTETMSGSGSGSGSDSGINETASKYGMEGVATVRPTAVSTTQSTMMAIPSDNNLRDEMRPSTPKDPRPGNKHPGVDDFDNTVPGGSVRNRNPLDGNNPVSPTVGDPSVRGSEDQAESPGTESPEGIATTADSESDTTTPVATIDTTTAGNNQGAQTTSPSNELTGNAETDAAVEQSLQTSSDVMIVSSSTPTHYTPLPSIALVICLALSSLY